MRVWEPKSSNPAIGVIATGLKLGSTGYDVFDCLAVAGNHCFCVGVLRYPYQIKRETIGFVIHMADGSILNKIVSEESFTGFDLVHRNVREPMNQMMRRLRSSVPSGNSRLRLDSRDRQNRRSEFLRPWRVKKTLGGLEFRCSQLQSVGHTRTADAWVKVCTSNEIVSIAVAYDSRTSTSNNFVIACVLSHASHPLVLRYIPPRDNCGEDLSVFEDCGGR